MYRILWYHPYSSSDPLFLASLGRATFPSGEGIAAAPLKRSFTAITESSEKGRRGEAAAHAVAIDYLAALTSSAVS